MPLALGRLTGRRRLVAFTLDRSNLLLHQGQSLGLPRDLPGETFRQGSTISGDQVRRRQGLVTRFDIDPANALGKEQALDPVDVGGSLTDQSVTECRGRGASSHSEEVAIEDAQSKVSWIREIIASDYVSSLPQLFHC